MDITVKCKSIVRHNFLKTCSEFYAKALNLEGSRYVLTIKSRYRLIQNKKVYGQVIHDSPRGIIMEIDSRLSVPRLLVILAHEMVHVKQIAKGQYKGMKSRNGRPISLWCGKKVKADYNERPWEIEAYLRQEELLNQLLEHMAHNFIKA
jgi:hypothetical protein